MQKIENKNFSELVFPQFQGQELLLSAGLENHPVPKTAGACTSYTISARWLTPVDPDKGDGANWDARRKGWTHVQASNVWSASVGPWEDFPDWFKSLSIRFDLTLPNRATRPVRGY